jgi:hypothetical protein
VLVVMVIVIVAAQRSSSPVFVLGSEIWDRIIILIILRFHFRSDLTFRRVERRHIIEISIS